MTDTDELSKLQMSGRVSLAVPVTGSPATQWHKKWNDIATDFSSIAYENFSGRLTFENIDTCPCLKSGGGH
ncbi:hypothetical protein WJX82_002866 [Trebouxia sp. C0006]